MQRILEPELMEDETQAAAYAKADFEEPHSRFIGLFRESFPRLDVDGYMIDLGCGAGDIAIRFARAFLRCVVHGVDGSPAMLREGLRRLADERCADVHGRVKLIEGLLPEAAMPREKYDAVICNSLLHQLHDPQTLWSAVKRFATSGAPVFIMDLRRPGSAAEAEAIRVRYVHNEPEILQRDFYNSLLAAFELEEIVAQLAVARLRGLSVQQVGDRHVLISGCCELRS